MLHITTLLSRDNQSSPLPSSFIDSLSPAPKTYDPTNTPQNWSENLCSTGLSIISATDRPTGKVVYEYICHQSHTNRMNNLHGGCTATIFDFCTTTALFPMSRPGFWEYAGVSRTLNVTYLKGVPVGEVTRIECEVVSIGKRLGE